eukprot:m.10572 g.10572  ORF g.10572 m.10572 type:complete len:72 (+) comp5627_c0_seq2:248-463(+)
MQYFLAVYPSEGTLVVFVRVLHKFLLFFLVGSPLSSLLQHFCSGLATATALRFLAFVSIFGVAFLFASCFP